MVNLPRAHDDSQVKARSLKFILLPRKIWPKPFIWNGIRGGAEKSHVDVYRVVRNRTWSIRGMFVMTAAAAIAIGWYLIRPDPYSDLSPGFGVAFRRLAAAVFFLPMTTFPYFLIAWTMQGRRRRIAWLLATTVLATAIAAAFMLAVDASAKSASQHYSWRAWWTIFIPAVWWAGALAYAVLIFNRPVCALYRCFLPAASDRSKLRDPT